MIIPTAFGDISVDQAIYRCGPCGVDVEGPDDTGPRQARKPVCPDCGGPTSYNGPVLPEPIASQGWNSYSIAEYWRGQSKPPYDTQLDFFDL